MNITSSWGVSLKRSVLCPQTSERFLLSGEALMLSVFSVLLLRTDQSVFNTFLSWDAFVTSLQPQSRWISQNPSSPPLLSAQFAPRDSNQIKLCHRRFNHFVSCNNNVRTLILVSVLFFFLFTGLRLRRWTVGVGAVGSWLRCVWVC